MKRGRDDEKIMGPMFPRLHVKDTEKGGPRAPPRNKMALYEQLSIPTQRFNPGVSNGSSVVPPGSSSQGSILERNSRLAYPITSTPVHLDEKFDSLEPAGSALSTPLPQHENSKKVVDEDDFAVPMFVQAGMEQCLGKSLNDTDTRNLSLSNPSYTSLSTRSQNACNKNPKCSSSSGLSLRQERRYQSQEDPNICISSRHHPLKSSVNLSSSQKFDGLVKEVSESPNQECRDTPGSNFDRFTDSYASVRQESGTDVPPNGCRRDEDIESTREIENSDTRSREDRSIPNGFDDDRRNVNKTHESLQFMSGDKCDDFSETSMVDSMSGVDMSPDDVVGIIGQKHFWKARRAIVNQQRVFAVQVFELHRLIKVQQLIAGSPDALLEEQAYIGKASLNASPAKKLPLEYVIKPLTRIVKRKDSFEKPNHKIECSAENAVGKRTSVSSVKKGSQLSDYEFYLANQPPIVAADSRMGPWGFNQSPGQQWLIPVMSPSEGLIYKPYPGPGFMGAGCGGEYSPFGSTHLTDTFMHPADGISSPIPHQGNGVMPGGHPVGQSYFPPFHMPNMNPSMSRSAAEHKNQFSESGHHSQFSQRGDDFSTQHESSCNVPAQRNRAVRRVRQSQVSKDTELQGSSPSSPGERGQGDMGHSAEGSEAPQLYTLSPDQTPKVIKVVPHNPRSATESAARIFQSIQEERQQNDSN